MPVREPLAGQGVREFFQEHEVLARVPADDEPACGQVEVGRQERLDLVSGQCVHRSQSNDKPGEVGGGLLEQPGQDVTGDGLWQPLRVGHNQVPRRVLEDDPFLPQCAEQAAQRDSQALPGTAATCRDSVGDLLVCDFAQADDAEPGPFPHDGQQPAQVAADHVIAADPVCALPQRT